MVHLSTLGRIAWLGMGMGALAISLGLVAFIQFTRDQRRPIECKDCGATDWLEAEECHTCLMCGRLRRVG